MDSHVGKILWRTDRLPTLVFLGFPGGSAGKESACNAGDLGSILGLGRFPWRKERLPTPVFWPGEFDGLYSLWGRKELDRTERLSLSVTANRSLLKSTAEWVRLGREFPLFLWGPSCFLTLQGH